MNATTMRSSGVGAFVAMLWRRGAEHFAPPRVVTAAAASDVGTVRANNEDYFLMADLARPAFTVRGSEPHAALTSHGPLLVVADGMGGAAGGEVGSAMAGEVICSHVTTAARDQRRRTVWQWRKILAEAFDVANQRIRSRGQADAALRGMGTTATAVAIVGDRLYVAHVGDSRAYLVRDGRARRLTRDHTWLQQMVETGRADTVAADDPRRNALLRALGTAPDVTGDTAHLDARAGDTVILCTDGLWSVVDDDELARLVAEHEDLRILCDTLLGLANGRGGRDNITVVAARLEAETR
jgi:protein phosphatase